MAEAAHSLPGTVLVGAGATVPMDAWGVLRRRLFGVPPADYGLVGRWIAWMPRGRWRHQPIAATPPVRGERLLGWAAHYLTGIALAALLLAIWGVEWICRPTLGPALLVGIGSVAAPFLLMQPGMGAGVAASRTPRPNAARINSIVTHGVFGVGLYAAAWLAKPLAGSHC